MVGDETTGTRFPDYPMGVPGRKTINSGFGVSALMVLLQELLR
jgi:hypothetical protein